MNEAQLIKSCIRKERKAWNIFVQKYSRLIYWAIRRRLNISSFEYNDDDVHNIFQEVFISILEGNKLGDIKDVKFLPGWLAMVASNKTVDFLREKIRHKQRFVADASLLKGKEDKEKLYHRDILETIKNVIDNLSVKEKIIISLNLLEGKTHREIAQVRCMPINTVSTTIARAKKKIKKELERRGIKNL
jgi:RNA polymerase sigma-70 factor (ECF subfamily)